MRVCKSFLIHVFFLASVQASAQSDTTHANLWTFHFMNTVVQQGHAAFQVPYAGIKSLSNESETQITVRNTWFFGRKIAKHTSVYINPELAGGSGLSGVAGIAAFPNGEAFRVGSGAPKVYVARVFIRHQILLNEVEDHFDNGVNQLQETLSTRRITLTAGKFSLLDFFDGSQYANDGRTEFMNWALMTGGAYDFASDTRGNTWGLVAEYFTPRRIIRFAATTPSSTANGPRFDFDFPHASGLNFEVRQDLRWLGSITTIGFTAFLNNTQGANFREILNTQPDSVIKYRSGYHQKYGAVLNIEHRNKSWAWFTSGSWANGKTENWGFTQIDRSLNAGVVIFGNSWKRPNDRFGLAGVISGLSPEQRDFLARGGNGFIIGDGQLHYQSERAIEVYYSIRASKNIFITFDYQYIWNMAFNADRGNIGVWGIRSHVEF